MFLTWVKTGPQHRELRALLLTNSDLNVPQLFTTRVVRMDLRLIVLIREEEDLKVLPFADVITKAALSAQLF